MSEVFKLMSSRVPGVNGNEKFQEKKNSINIFKKKKKKNITLKSGGFFFNEKIYLETIQLRVLE